MSLGLKTESKNVLLGKIALELQFVVTDKSARSCHPGAQPMRYLLSLCFSFAF